MGGARQEGVAGVFERHAARYDLWYESGPGSVLFEAELAALRLVVEELPGPILEIGVGTGRFANALGAEVGVDPARAVLEVLRQRCGATVLPVQADGAQLPFRDGAFGAALFVLTLCFTAQPQQLVREAARVVRPGGGVVAAIVDRESPWGAWYLEKKAQGHPFYEHARFLSAGEVAGYLQEAGLRLERQSCTLLQPPGETPVPEPPVDSLVPGAGFVCLMARRPTLMPRRPTR